MITTFEKDLVNNFCENCIYIHLHYYSYTNHANVLNLLIKKNKLFVLFTRGLIQCLPLFSHESLEKKKFTLTNHYIISKILYKSRNKRIAIYLTTLVELKWRYIPTKFEENAVCSLERWKNIQFIKNRDKIAASPFEQI